MIELVKIKFIFAIFFCLVLLSSFPCYAEVKAGQRDSSTLGKEILVAKDLGGGDDVYYTRWCGNNALIYKRVNAGVEWVDIHTRERIKIKIDYDDLPLNCTPDSQKLLFYYDKSRRDNEEIDEANELTPRVFGWRDNTEDIYIYEPRSGKRTNLATARRSTLYEALSPDGTKVLLGRKYKGIFKRGAPEWEGVWFTENWTSAHARWFPDLSGVVTNGQLSDDKICVEKFGENGWAKCFDLESGSDKFKVGRDSRIYYLAIDGNIWEPHNNHLYQCDIENKELKCKRILKEFDDVLPSFDFLSNGDIIFQDRVRYDCIWRATPGQSNARCVILPEFKDDSVSLIGISPDGRWLAFRRSNRSKEKTKNNDYFWTGDLFVIELTDD